MVSFDQLSRLIDRVYDVAETGRPWEECLLTICRDLKATGTNLVTFSPSGTTSVMVHAGYDPADMAKYLAHFHRLAPWKLKRPVPTIQIGDVIPGSAVIPHSDLRRTEFYADFGRSADITRALHAIVMKDVDGSRVGLSSNRGDRAREFGSQEIAYISALLPHLGRALQSRARLGAAAQIGHAALDAMDLLPLGVIVVDGNARVRHSNTQASHLLRTRDGIGTDGTGRLRGATADATRRLRAACAAIAASRGSLPRDPGATLTMPRAEVTPLQVLVVPVRPHGQLACLATDAAAVLYVTDPEHAVAFDQETLRATYGFTGAEARVAALIAGGMDVATAARRLDYTLETTRWYVKQVLAKSGCQSRSEFAARLTSSLATLRRE